MKPKHVGNFEKHAVPKVSELTIKLEAENNKRRKPVIVVGDKG